MRNNNITIAQDMNRIFDLKGEQTDEVADYIQPTIEIKRFCNINKTQVVSNATSATIYTTPADKDFYVVSASISMVKDITATSTNSWIGVTIEGVAVTFLPIAGITLTPDTAAFSISFPTPLKIDRGTAITINNGTNVANVIARGAIHGYTVETTKGS